MRRARTFFFVGTVLLVVASSVLSTWSTVNGYRRYLPTEPIPLAALVARSIVFVALVGTALEVNRRGAGSGVATLFAGDSLMWTLKAITNRLDSETLREHESEVGIAILVMLLFALVLREAPFPEMPRLARVFERVRPVWPVVVALVASIVLMTFGWGWAEQMVPKASLLLGGLVVVTVFPPGQEASTGFGVLTASEWAIVPDLTAYAFLTLVLERETLGIDAHLPGVARDAIELVTRHVAAVSFLPAVLVLLLEVVAFRRAARGREAR